MTILSLREAWRQRYGDVDLRAGLRTNVHPFYTAVSDSLPASTLPQRQRAFPCRSLRNFIEALAWPRSFVPTRATSYDYPRNKGSGWTDKLQGVTHDDQHWYFTQQDRLWKIPVTHDLHADLGDFASVGIPIPGYIHFGDIDFFNGHIYVPLEGDGQPATVVVFNQSLQYKKSALLSAQGGSGPWCAINPVNGLLYSSTFNDTPDRILFQVYERIESTNDAGELVDFKLNHLGAMELFDETGDSFHLGGLQGAAFSRRGHLYLVVDTVMNSANEDGHRGIMGFDMLTGRRTVHRLVDYRPWKFFPRPIGWVKIQELEGITIWEDVDATGAPGIIGQLHLVMLDKDWENDDDLYFKHYEVEFPEDRGKV